jgi:hypothetical protein
MLFGALATLRYAQDATASTRADIIGKCIARAGSTFEASYRDIQLVELIIFLYTKHVQT